MNIQLPDTKHWHDQSLVNPQATIHGLSNSSHMVLIRLICLGVWKWFQNERVWKWFQNERVWKLFQDERVWKCFQNEWVWTAGSRKIARLDTEGLSPRLRANSCLYVRTCRFIFLQIKHFICKKIDDPRPLLKHFCRTMISEECRYTTEPPYCIVRPAIIGARAQRKVTYAPNDSSFPICVL
jgi:hypothetical protein